MAITSAVVSHFGTGGSVSRSGARRYVVDWNVKTDDPQDGVIAIAEYFRTTGGLPWLGSYYSYFGEEDLNSFCERIIPAKKDRSQFEWTVRLEYQERDARQDESGNPTNDPLLQMRLFRFFHAGRQVPVPTAAWGGVSYKDPATGNRIDLSPTAGFYNGRSIGDVLVPSNTAGDPFDPSVLVDQSDLLFNCTVNLPSYDYDKAQAMVDTLNSNDVQLDLTATIYQTHLKLYKWTAKIVNYGATFMAENFTDAAGVSKTQYYWEHSFDIAIREGIRFGNAPPLGWREWVPNTGYNRSARAGDPDGKGGTIGSAPAAGRSITARILDADKLPISEPAALDVNGQPNTSALLPINVEYNAMRVTDFTTIPGIGFTPWAPP